MAWLELMTGKPIADKPALAVARTAAYHAELGDLNLAQLWVGARALMSERTWPTFPLVAELRKSTLEWTAAPEDQLTAGEAWRLASDASFRFISAPPEYQIPFRGGICSPRAWNEHVLAALPPRVAQSLRCFGFRPLPQNETCRAQFRDIFNAIAVRESRRKCLPATVTSVLRLLDRTTALPKGIASKESS